jgi:broad specificity phosphatase PhoE
MQNLYIFRHGETIWNKEERLQGKGDSPLTPEGIEILKSQRNLIEGITFDQVYCSPLGRARHSLEIISPRTEKPIIYDARIQEINLGILEGHKYNHLPEEFQSYYHDFIHNPPHFSAPQSESYEDVLNRVYDFLAEIDQKDQNILVMAHGIVLRLILASAMELPLEKIWEAPDLINATCVIFSLENNTLKLESIEYPQAIISQ